jgi:ABC-type branched-subunit amino acid transport system permease subunit
VATVVGLFVAVSALRVRGVSLAVVTLAAAVMIEQFVFLNSTWGGGTSSSPVPEPKLWGLDLGPSGPFRGLDGNVPSPVFGFFVVALTVALGLFVAISAARRSDSECWPFGPTSERRRPPA